MFNASPLPSALVRNADLQLVKVNDAYIDAFAWSREELLARALTPVWFADPSEVVMLVDHIRRSANVRGIEVQMRRRDGELRTLQTSLQAIEIDGDAHTLLVLHDVTDRRRSEQALKASEARFATAFMRNPLPAAIVRLSDYHFIDVNEAFVALFGYAREELAGQSTTLHNFWVDMRERAPTYARFFADGKLADYPVRMITRAGVARDLLWSMEHIDVAGEASVIILMQDVTKRKRDEQALRESEARFRQLAENIREVFWICAPGGGIVHYVSPAYESIWGRSVAALVARGAEWPDSIHPADRERVLDGFAAQAASGGTYEATYRIERPDGTLRWIHDRGFPVHDDRGAVIRVVGFAEDITERLRLEEELRQTQKMESLGMLAGGVAHDFNNVLAVIASCNGLLGEEMADDDPHRELVEEVEAAVTRAAALTRQLLAFSRKQVTDPKVIELNSIVNETRKMLRRMVGEDIVLTTSLEPELGHVRIDPGCLVQVLMNLAVNARDAMPRGGTLSVTTRNTVIDDAHVRLHPNAKAGPAVLLEVIDTGIGMPPDVLARIFEPFFTTKEHGKGTGMGLAVVHGIIDQAGGFIEVTSHVADGSTFGVYLPVVDDTVSPASEIAASIARGTEHILLVDDDDHVRRSTARSLRARGYYVVEASSGAAALAHLVEHCQHFDLLLTDVVMPAMDGRQLAELARMHCPRLHIVYMSGYTDDAVVRHGVMQGQVDLIEKPFRIDTLAMRVRQVLDRPLAAESAGRLRGPQDVG